MSKKNKPGYIRREALRNAKKTGTENEFQAPVFKAKEWAEQFMNRSDAKEYYNNRPSYHEEWGTFGQQNIQFQKWMDDQVKYFNAPSEEAFIILCELVRDKNKKEKI